MPFPFPLDVDHRIAVIHWWLDDVEDRLLLGRTSEAITSYHTARDLYLKLPGGINDQNLEDRMIATQGKINQTSLT
jgi:hypothetical protein